MSNHNDIENSTTSLEEETLEQPREFVEVELGKLSWKEKTQQRDDMDIGQFLKITADQSRRSVGWPSDEFTKEESGSLPPLDERTGTTDEDEDLECENRRSVRKVQNKSSGCCSKENKRVKELYTTADWWSLWVGLASFILAFVLVFVVLAISSDSNTESIIPQPQDGWKSNPWDAWNLYNLIGIPLLLMILASFYLMSLYFMGKLQTEHPQETNPSSCTTVTATKSFTDATKIKIHLQGFAFMSFLATLSLWLGGNAWAKSNGLGYAVVSVVLGMVLANIPATAKRILPWAAPAAVDGEFFVKASLTLLAVELDVLVQVGGPGMIVSWIGSPMAVIFGFWLGTRWFGCNPALAMLIAVGASWCGASAITAVAPIVGARSDDVALAISVVTFFTIIFTFAQPYLAIGVGMPDDIAGAWIGGSVDQTGNVIVSAAIVSDKAAEVAAIVKMVLNASLGVMASVISCYWNSRHAGDEKKEFRWITLWDKFPKFTLGFVVTSLILTGTMQLVRGTPAEEAIPNAIEDMTKWWFAISFVGIGLTTNVKSAWEKAWNSGIIQVYLLANTFDILLALGLAYLAYGPVMN